jgi:Spy/CpxP family protein refolding chaperone
MWMKLTAGAVLAAGAVFAQTAAPAPEPQPGQRRAMNRGRMMMANPQVRFQRFANYLGFTLEQRQQAKAIFQEAKAAADPIRPQVKAGREALAAAVKTGKGGAEIERLSAQQGVLMGQLIAIRTKAMEKVYALLTPEQRQKADELQNNLRQRMQNRGRRNG